MLLNLRCVAIFHNNLAENKAMCSWNQESPSKSQWNADISSWNQELAAILLQIKDVVAKYQAQTGRNNENLSETKCFLIC